MIIENELPRLLSFKGKLKLIPGVNKEVDEELFNRLWQVDKTLRYYFTERCICLYDDDGKEMDPPDLLEGDDEPDLKKNKRGPDKKHLIGVKATPSLMRPKEQKPVEEKAKAAKSIEPTPVAGVPGNANQAKASISACSDSKQLLAWKASEEAVETPRTSVLKAIDSRLEEL